MLTVPSRHLRRPRSTRRGLLRLLFPFSFTAILLMGILPAPAQGAVEDNLLFVRPNRLLRIQGDPWQGGAWLATEAGAFHHGENGILRHYSYNEGLPSATVNDLVPEADVVWMGTGQGLVVLDRATQ